MSKRQRTDRTFTRAARPVDKDIIVVAKSSLGSSQVSTTLHTATFPCTITGLRWSLEAAQDAGTAVSKIAWAIVIVPQGEAANAMSLSDAATFYAPEQNVMAFGHGLPQTGSNGVKFEGSTKTMRKMRGGDLLQIVAVAEATNLLEFFGAVQFFCKT